jgi:sensor histidine kinase regulating citrate/malate metabolism
MPQGGEIGLEWSLSESRQELVILFWDTGPGLDRESVEKVVSGVGLPTQKRLGSGLGLISVQRMLTQLGGSFELESNQTSGTHWMLRIPIAERE